MTKPAKAPRAYPAGTRDASAKARQEPAAYRVNARLDGEQAAKLAFLAETTGLSTSEVMREAIDRFHAQVRQQHRGQRPVLESLIGKYAGGPADLATNYKRYLGESLIRKHGHR